MLKRLKDRMFNISLSVRNIVMFSLSFILLVCTVMSCVYSSRRTITITDGENPGKIITTSKRKVIDVLSENGFVLNEGDRLPFVYVLQVVLNGVSSLPPLPITGVYDKATVERVITLKRLAEYPPTPTLDRLFWDYLAVWYNGRDMV